MKDAALRVAVPILLLGCTSCATWPFASGTSCEATIDRAGSTYALESVAIFRGLPEREVEIRPQRSQEEGDLLINHWTLERRDGSEVSYWVRCEYEGTSPVELRVVPARATCTAEYSGPTWSPRFLRCSEASEE